MSWERGFVIFCPAIVVLLGVLERRATELLDWLADNYAMQNANEAGVWYRLTGDAEASSTG